MSKLTTEQKLEKAKQAKAKAERQIALIKQQERKKQDRQKIIAGAIFAKLIASQSFDPGIITYAEKFVAEKDLDAWRAFIKNAKEMKVPEPKD